MSTFDRLALEAWTVERAGRSFKQLNTKHLRDEQAKAARDFSRRLTNVSRFAVGTAAIELAHAATTAWSLALDRLGRD
jgi:hypothetical protein